MKVDVRGGARQRILRSFSVNTAHYLVDSRLINARFVSYDDQAPPPLCLPSCPPDVMHVTFSPRPSPSVFANWKQSKTGSGTDLGMGLTRSHYVIW